MEKKEMTDFRRENLKGICEVCGQERTLYTYIDMEVCADCFEMAEDVYLEGEEFLQALQGGADREWDEFYQKFYLGEDHLSFQKGNTTCKPQKRMTS